MSEMDSNIMYAIYIKGSFLTFVFTCVTITELANANAN